MDTAVAAEPRPRHPCLAIAYAAKAQSALITEPLAEALTDELTETLTGTNQPSSKALLHGRRTTRPSPEGRRAV